MFDIGWQELFIVAVLALIVVGPKDLPRMIRTLRTWIRRAREMARDFQSGLDDVVREAELDDLRRQVNSASDPTKALADQLDPTGEFADDLNMRDIEKDLSDTAKEFRDSTTPVEAMDPDEGKPEPVADTTDAAAAEPPASAPAADDDNKAPAAAGKAEG